MHPNCKSLAGQRFGLLTVVERVLYLVGPVVWECKCDCGKLHRVRASNLKNGHVKSCGCSKGALITSAKIRHGKSLKGQWSQAYRAWSGMKSRCYRPSSNRFKNYGERGIKVCDRWLLFDNFLEDMGEPTGDAMTIGRIDNNRGYEPGNCRWETYKQQARNTTRTHWVTLGKVKKPLKEWCEIYETHYGTVHWRISSGWPAQLALSTPIRKGNYKCA